MKNSNSAIATHVAVIRGLSDRAQILLAANAVNSFGAGLVAPFLLIYLHHARGMSLSIGAAALAVTGIFSFASGLIWGTLLDRYPHRLVMPAVMVLGGIGTMMYAAASNPWITIVASVVYGSGLGGVGTVINTMFAMVTQKQDRQMMFGIGFSLHNAFAGLGILVGGLLATGSTHNYQLLYLGDGLSFMVGAASIAIFLPSQAGAADPAG